MAWFMGSSLYDYFLAMYQTKICQSRWYSD